MTMCTLVINCAQEPMTEIHLPEYLTTLELYNYNGAPIIGRPTLKCLTIDMSSVPMDLSWFGPGLEEVMLNGVRLIDAPLPCTVRILVIDRLEHVSLLHEGLEELCVDEFGSAPRYQMPSTLRQLMVVRLTTRVVLNQGLRLLSCDKLRARIPRLPALEIFSAYVDALTPMYPGMFGQHIRVVKLIIKEGARLVPGMFEEGLTTLDLRLEAEGSLRAYVFEGLFPESLVTLHLDVGSPRVGELFAPGVFPVGLMHLILYMSHNVDVENVPETVELVVMAPQVNSR